MQASDLVPLGRTAVTVSRIGLGTAPLAGLYERVSEDDVSAVVNASLAAGIRLYDTAPLYGYGDAERRLGAALRGTQGGDAVVATKVGRVLRSAVEDDGGIFPGAAPERPVFDFSYEGVMRSFEESLARLGLDRVDILHIHDPDDHFDQAVDGAHRALAELRAAGTIGAVGAGMNQAAMLADLALRADFDCFLLAGRYTLLDQSGLSTLLPLCAARGIGVIVGGVYNSGVLADPRRAPRYDYAPAPTAVTARALGIESVCARHGVPLKAAAIQFPFGHPAVASVLSGARSTAEVEENIAMAAVPIPAALWSDLKRESLLPENVPTP